MPLPQNRQEFIHRFYHRTHSLIPVKPRVIDRAFYEVASRPYGTLGISISRPFP
jgi:hypothetical protein